jgi:hypothetical protein
MRFEERQLKRYAEPVSNGELKEDSVYFFVNFVDDEMLLPNMEPVVFAGRDLEQGDAGRVYFQDVDSFRRGVRYGQTEDGDDATFYSGSEKELAHVFDYEHALEVLMACSIRRIESPYKPT